jgi:copper(I)-binding protein
MLMKLVKPLELGAEISVTLKFSKAGDVVVTVPVLEEAP